MMTAQRLLPMALLLALAGCADDRSPPSNSNTAPTTPAVGDEQQAPQAPATTGGDPARAAQALAPTQPVLPGKGPAPALGADRAAVLAFLGTCAERVKFAPATPASPVLEVFQPQAGDCLKELPRRCYIVVGDRLVAVEEGLRTKPALPAPPANRDTAKY